MFESKEALKALQAWAALSCPFDVHLRSRAPGRALWCQSATEGAQGPVWSGSVTSVHWQSRNIKKHGNFRLRVGLTQRFAESQQDEAALHEATAGLWHWLELRFSWRFQSLLTFFDLWWLCWAETLRVPWCFSKGMPCRGGGCIFVHIVRLLPVLSSKEFMPVQSGRTQGQQELLWKIQHSCCNDGLNLVSYDLIA